MSHYILHCLVQQSNSAFSESFWIRETVQRVRRKFSPPEQRGPNLNWTLCLWELISKLGVLNRELPSICLGLPLMTLAISHNASVTLDLPTGSKAFLRLLQVARMDWAFPVGVQSWIRSAPSCHICYSGCCYALAFLQDSFCSQHMAIPPTLDIRTP